jgi:transposase
MRLPPLAKYQIRLIRENYLSKKLPVLALAAEMGVRNPVIYKYIKAFKEMGLRYPHQAGNINFQLYQPKSVRPPTKRLAELHALLPVLIAQTTTVKAWKIPLWQAYREFYPAGYTLNTFMDYVVAWQQSNDFCPYAHRKVRTLLEQDIPILRNWLISHNHDHWLKAVVITESQAGTPLKDIASRVRLTIRTLLKWILLYNESGLAGLKRKNVPNHNQTIEPRERRKINLIKLIHESPRLHGISRVAWRLTDLAAVHNELHGGRLASSTVRTYLRQAGFQFRQAKVMLTSPDPKYREKLDQLKSVLARLSPTERFFSIDEYGPAAVKMKPGATFVTKDELKTVKQYQKSKGWYICTAALELSKNQVTHFFSRSKDTGEMVKLIDLLLLQYNTQTKLYFSWDAASWHSSNQLKAHIRAINDQAKRNLNTSPFVELVPLPSSAQFLNVIESVFSGMARAVIHNSDYQSLDECKEAISRHFEVRNAHFKKNPKKAGNKIWGLEFVKPEFNEAQNCKDPKLSW